MSVLKGENKDNWIHFTAVGGKGMGALAVLLADHGYVVTGSDNPLFEPMDEYIANSKVQFKDQFLSEHLYGKTWGINKEHPDLVIVGNAISRGHVEAALVEELLEQKKIQRMSFSEALASFAIANNRSFVVTGTHGKSTTSSMLTWIFDRLQKKPGFFIGAIPANYDGCCRLADNSVFVTEGDEYDTAYWDKVSKFLHYKPHWVICTGVEFDHADIFKDLAAIEDSFLNLVKKTKQGWVLVENQSAPEPEVTKRLAMAVTQAKLDCVRYGYDHENDFCASSWKSIPFPSLNNLIGTEFEVVYKGKKRKFLSSMIGSHNLLNALSCIAVLVSSGEVAFDKLPEDFLLDYKGIAKRQEELFSSEQSVLVDDFAHHPRAIQETLAALKLRYPGRAVKAFFEPRSATSARNIMFDAFVESFESADEVYLVEATKKNVPESERLNIPLLKEKLEKKSKVVHSANNFESLFQAFQKRVIDKPELIVLMSNGSFGGLADKIKESLL